MTAPALAEPWESGPPPGFDPDPDERQAIQAEHPGPDPLAGPPVDVTPDGHDGEGAETRAPDPDAWRELVTLAPVEWFTTPPPARTWLLRDSRPEKSPGLLPLGKAGMLVAEGGAGKTMLLCQLAIAVATGTPFLGCFTVATRGRVLLVLGEEDATEAHRRLYNASRTGTPTPPEESIAVLPLAGRPCAMLERDECGNPVDTPFALSLSAYVDAERVAGRPFVLVVLDPLSRFAGPDAETDNATATRFVQSVERLASPDVTTALVSHHNNKLSRGRRDVATSDGRGSSAFGDGFRWVATLTPADVRKALEDPDERDRLGELATLVVTKSNYGRKGDPMQLRRDPDRNGVLVPLDETDLATVEAARTTNPARKARTEAQQTERERTRAARDLKEAQQREAKAAQTEANTRARNEEADAAARAARAANPDAPDRDLTAIVKKSLACGTTLADAAVRRTRVKP